MKKYRKTALLVIVRKDEKTYWVRNEKDTEHLDVWPIPKKTFEETYEEVK